MADNLQHQLVGGHLRYQLASGHLLYDAADLNVTFAGNVQANDFGIPAYFYGTNSPFLTPFTVAGVSWYENGRAWADQSFCDSISVDYDGSIPGYRCKIIESWGQYFDAQSWWTSSSLVGSYSFELSYLIGEWEADNVTAVSVAIA